MYLKLFSNYYWIFYRMKLLSEGKYTSKNLVIQLNTKQMLILYGKLYKKKRTCGIWVFFVSFCVPKYNLNINFKYCWVFIVAFMWVKGSLSKKKKAYLFATSVLVSDVFFLCFIFTKNSWVNKHTSLGLCHKCQPQYSIIKSHFSTHLFHILKLTDVDRLFTQMLKLIVKH